MRYHLLLFGILAIALHTACVSTIHKPELCRRARQSQMHSMLRGYNYCGSKKGFDYFRGDEIGWSLPKSVLVRVPEDESAVPNRFAYTRNKKKWVRFTCVNPESEFRLAPGPAEQPLFPNQFQELNRLPYPKVGEP